MRFWINNFIFSAYNNVVEEITITQNGFDGLYMSYLYGKVRERFSFLPSECDLNKQGEVTELAFKTESAYCPYVRKFAEENIADVIAVGYKYAYFDKRLPLPMLTKMQRRLLLTALVAADYKEDRAYVARRIRGFEKYCLDGVFHFRLQDLKKRWDGIVEYIPTDMGEASMEGFIEFLAEDGEGKIFLKDGKVYDEKYRLQSKSLLTGVESAIGEILLGGAEQVYCFGKTDDDTRAFLRKYYGDKAVFC
ncbi:MAG: hypothetical protein E7366_00220 [Clostridiales bacterium]|nr:hypothetical protein [Clostridiales bacterium]